MRSLLSFWREEISRNPVVMAPLACLIASCAMNVHAAHALSGGSMTVVAIFLSIAMMTAYCGTTGLALPAWTFRKQMLIGFFVIGIVVDQFSAWQTLGIQFADGQVARDSKATGLGSVSETLKRKRQELADLGRTRPIDTIDAAAYLECKVVGPRCTALREELGRARRAAQLDKEIPALVAQLEGREQVASGQVQFTVPIQIAQGVLDWWYRPAPAPHVQGDHISFTVMMVLAAVVCLLANMGFWLVGVGHEPTPTAHAGPPLQLPPPSAASAPAVPLAPAPGGPQGAAAAPPAPAVEHGLPQWPAGGPPLPSDFARGACDVARERYLPAAPGAPGGGSSVSITIGGVPVAGQAQAPGAAPVAPVIDVKEEAPPEPIRPRHDLDALEPDQPVDRTRVRRQLSDAERAACDVILAFEAACVVASPGAMVSAENLYRRYQAWAGARAIEPEAFVALWPELTGRDLVSLGGQLHVQGLALRVAPALQPVEGSSHAA